MKVYFCELSAELQLITQAYAAIDKKAALDNVIVLSNKVCDMPQNWHITEKSHYPHADCIGPNQSADEQSY